MFCVVCIMFSVVQLMFRYIFSSFPQPVENLVRLLKIFVETVETVENLSLNINAATLR